MSRRSLISEALASPLPAPEPALTQDLDTEAQPRVNFTSKRIEAFGEAARLVKRPTIRLKPDEASIWPGNARDYRLLTEDRMKSLIDSILSEGGNRIPACVRRTPNSERPYELITGTRRHWAVAWLNAHHYPEIDLVAYIEDLDEEAAFRLADLENREREDISDLERARNYKYAIDQYYDGKQARMAERLKFSSSKLSRYIALTDLPAEIINAFSSPMDLLLTYGANLSAALKDKTCRPKMIKEATSIAEEQSFRQSEAVAPIPGSEVTSRILNARRARPVRADKLAIIAASGGAVGRVERDSRQGLSITLNPTDLTPNAILEALRPVIEGSKILKPRSA